MEATFHQWAAEDYAAQLEQTEAGRRRMAEYRDRFEQQDLRPTLDAIGQPVCDQWTPGQVATLGRVQDLMLDGRLQAMLIPLGSEPSSPTDLDVDRSVLDRLGELFTTLVHQQVDDCGNGIIAWDPRIAHQLPGGWTKSAPLVIGNTDPSRTLLHLTDKGVVARWPHGSDDLWLFGFEKFTTWFEWCDESFTHLLDDA